MKIAIITITDGQNYGNRLQNYAMQYLLEKMDAHVETIRRRTSRDIRGIKKVELDIKHCVKIILGRPSDKWRRIRKKRFKQFNQKYIQFSDDIIEKNRASEKLKDKYDFFVCGSDQIWNTHFDIIQEDLKNYLASFAKPSQKIAYAASFGTSDIPTIYQNIFKENLIDFKALSVRENSGVDLIKDICERRDVEVVLDPTMMLEAEEWRNISRKPENIGNEKFFVTYFLGGRNKKVEDYIKSIELKNQWKAHNLDIEFKTDIEIDNWQDYIISPEEFIWLMDHAECVLTDSFHATVFAILFHKPFCVFDRTASEDHNNMESRIQTLLEKFGLLKFRGKIESMDIYPEEYDVERVEEVLEKERKKSNDFLKSALNIG